MSNIQPTKYPNILVDGDGLVDKAVKVISSCTTDRQLQQAYRYVNLAAKYLCPQRFLELYGHIDRQRRIVSKLEPHNVG